MLDLKRAPRTGLPAALALSLAAALLAPSSGRAGEEAPSTLREEAEEALIARRWPEALAKYRALFAASGDGRDACTAGQIAHGLGEEIEAFELLSLCDRLGEKARVPRTAVASALWGIAVVGEVTSPVKVEVVPTVGGAVLHGTF